MINIRITSRNLLGTYHCMLGSLLLLGISQNTNLIASDESESAPSGPRVTNFAGAVNGDVPDLSGTIGWDREDVDWSGLEPVKGEWKNEALQQIGDKVLQMRKLGINFLPILDYNAPWSWDHSDQVYTNTAGNLRVSIHPAGKGQFQAVHEKKDDSGNWTATKSETVSGDNHWPLAEEHVADWENYVRKVVTFLGSEPYNVKYFQIWNEAYQSNGFWGYGDLDTFIKRVHIPAANVIHELGKKVVYGGWPDVGTPKEYIAMLDRTKAWNTIDVYDMHYFHLWDVDELSRAAQERNLGSVSIWETEYGYTPDVTLIGNSYPRFLAWALQHDWADADKYKVFWYSGWAPNDPNAFGYKTALVTGSALTPHGLSLKTLNQVLSGNSLGLYSGKIVSTPSLPQTMYDSDSSMEAFLVDGKKIVLSIHSVGNSNDPHVQVNLQDLTGSMVDSISRVDLSGNKKDVDFVQGDMQGPLSLTVPVRDDAASPTNTWSSDHKTKTFFIVINLKSALDTKG